MRRFAVCKRRLKCRRKDGRLTCRMKSGYSFAEDEIRELFDLQKKWEMSDSLLAYLDTYSLVCCQNPMIRTRRFFKVIVVGDTGFSCLFPKVSLCRSGKTSLLMRYVNGVFSPMYQATIGASVLSKVVNEESEMQAGVFRSYSSLALGHCWAGAVSESWNEFLSRR